MNALNISALPVHMDAALPFALAFTCGLLLVIIMRHAAHKTKAQDMIFQAKQEAEGIAQLAMTNPHPLIRLTMAGEISFINPVALENFESILKAGARHPIFVDIDFSAMTQEPLERDIEYKGRIFHQNILRTGTYAGVAGADIGVGSDSAFIIHCIDITNLKKTERALQDSLENAEKSRRDAEQAKEARGEFLANMSHELRTPMNGIIGLSGLLYENEPDTGKKALAEAVHFSATNLLGLLNDILDFSKIEAGELSIERVPFALDKLIQEIRLLHEHSAGEKGIKLESHINPDCPSMLIGDPLRLRQILNNLLSNAVKFTHHGSVMLTVTPISQDHQNCTLSLSVKDTGIGIPQAKQALVFEKFQQADTSTSRHYGGTGLGLSITKRLCDLMGGALSLQSAEEKGTTVTLTLDFPVASNLPLTDEQENKAILTPDKIKPDSHCRILIADDHPVNLLFLRNLLEQSGLGDIDEASNGLHAIKLYEQRRHTLILMDCQMPEMDGYEAAHHIRISARKNGEYPIMIAVTADAMKGAVQKAMQAGMDDYISKPIDKTQLLKILHQWMDTANKASTSARAYIAANKTDTHADQNTKDNTMHDLPIIERSILQDYSGGDPETEAVIIRIFKDNLQADMNALQAALDAGDYPDWSATTHKIYGGCANFGAKRVAALCDTAQDTPIERTQQIRQFHTHIIEQCHIVLRELSAAP